MLHSLAIAFNAGGPFMWVILVVFAIACTVVADRLIFYFIICQPNGVMLVADVAKALNANDVAAAKKAVSKTARAHERSHADRRRTLRGRHEFRGHSEGR